MKTPTYTVTIEGDYDSENPRHWDNLGTLVSFSRELDGDLKTNCTPAEYLDNIKDTDIVLPVYMYKHSGTALSTTPFSCRWDSGQIGYIHVSKKKALAEYGGKIVTSDLRKRIENCLCGEIETMHQWVSGDVWRYSIEAQDGNIVDSCGGFYGYEDCEKQANEMLSSLVATDMIEHVKAQENLELAYAGL
jgi:hypothetical protein